MTLQLEVPTVLNGRKVIVGLFHDRTNIARVVNPPPVSLQIYDGATGQRQLEAARLPYDPALHGPDVPDLELRMLELAQRYCLEVQKRGHFVADAPAFRMSLEQLETPLELEQSLPEAVKGFFETVNRLLGRRNYFADGIALAVGCESETLQPCLQKLLNDGTLEMTEQGFEMHQEHAVNPWLTAASQEVRQDLGVKGRLLRVMVAGPGDTVAEVEAAREVIEAWNIRNAEELGVFLLFKHWKTHSVPTMGERPQAIINRQLAEKADLLVAIFWNRLGMPTGVEISGTVEEINVVNSSGKPVQLYFASKPIEQALLADERAIDGFRQVKTFQREIEEQRLGMYGSFGSTETFKTMLDDHLTIRVRELRDAAFSVKGTGRMASRAFLAKTTGELAAMKKAVRSLQRDFKTNLTAVENGLTRALRSANQLSTVLATHLSDWEDALTTDAQELLESLITAAKQLASTPITFGSGGQIEGGGTQLFAQTLSWIEVFEEGLRTLDD